MWPRLLIATESPLSNDGDRRTADRVARMLRDYPEAFAARATFVPHPASQSLSTAIPDGMDIALLPHFGSAGDFVVQLPRVLRRLWSAIGDCDLVIARMPGFVGVCAALIGRSRSKDVWVVMVGNWMDTVGREKGGQLLRRSAARFLSFVAARAGDRVFVQGADLLRTLPPTVRRKATVVVETPLRADDFLPVATRAEPRVLVAARLVPIKRVDVAIRAVANARTNGVPATLTIAGDGPARPALQELVKHLEIDNHVAFLGNLENRAQLRELYREAFAYIVSSETEGVSYSAIEAMAAGAVVLSTPAGGMRSFIRDGLTGLLVDPSVDAIADALVTLWRKPEERLAIARRAQEAVSGLTHESWAWRLRSLYDRQRNDRYRLPGR